VSVDERRNTFSERTGDYVRSRPQYPEALYDWITSQCDRRVRAWDCATGSGQAAVGLAPHFERVCATDVSPEQIAQAMRRDNVSYSVASAEESGLPDSSFNLVVVAQALHWFDYPRFWREVDRVATRGAFFCAWGYHRLGSTAAVDREFFEPLTHVLAPFWASKNRILWNGYRDEDVSFPFERAATPNFSIEVNWTIEQLILHVTTWSAYKHSRTHADTVVKLDRLFDLMRIRFSSGESLPIRVPLTMLAGRVKSSFEPRP
jgi:hypothetical protein